MPRACADENRLVPLSIIRSGSSVNCPAFDFEVSWVVFKRPIILEKLIRKNVKGVACQIS